MAGDHGLFEVGSVNVVTTSKTGLTPEYWAERALERIIAVGEKSHPLVIQQAQEFKDNIRDVLIYYFRQAVKSDRTTLYNLFNQQGHDDMAEILRRL